MFFVPIFISSIEDDNDREFMEQLYTEHYTMMYNLARKYAQNIYDIDDIISEACLALIRKIPLLRTLSSNERLGYVNATTRNTGLKFCKSKYRRHESPTDGYILNKEESTQPDIDKALLEKITISDIKTALDRLNESDRDLLTMKYILEIPDSEIEDMLNIKHGALRTRLSRARHRLYGIYSEKCEV